MPGSASDLAAGILMVVRKSERRLLVYDGGSEIASFDIVLGVEPIGDKVAEGDGRTPIGEFVVAVKNPASKYFRSLGLNYPTAAHAERGAARGLISDAEWAEIEHAVGAGKMPPQKTALGGEIYIHGGGIDSDWTRGCIALRDDDMLWLFEKVELGANVRIEP
jgi:murein L,D-transpeptidase YafK